VQPAVHKASTVLFANTAALRARTWKEKTGYTYGLHGTPTTFILEERIATLEGGLQTLLTPSGLAAITLVNAALLKSGDEVLIPDNAYGPAKELARNELRAGASPIASTTRWMSSRCAPLCRRRPAWSGSSRRAR
jgi:cystathionine beta-lyase